MNLNLVLSVLIIVNFIGCSVKEKIKINEPPKKQVVKKTEKIIKHKGSLYTRRGASLFSDKKDLQVGDIVLVRIYEKLKNDSKDERKLDKTNSTNIGGGLFTKLSAPGGTPIVSGASLNGTLGLGFQTDSVNKLNGKSSSLADEKLETRISTVIEKRYQNGNYFIKGTKQILINNQKQTVMISGVIRPYDIGTDNIIESNRIANLKIFYNKDGDEQDSTDKPWGSKFIESISPF